MKAKEYFTDDRRKLVRDAIAQAENQTSGEIRVHIEDVCKEEVLDHAAFIFEKLEMHKTRERSGVLIYLALDSHKFAILGDSGINGRVPKGFWDDTRDKMLEHFRQNEIAEGLAEGIKLAGEQLSQHFPVRKDDTNELRDDISFGSKNQSN